jgi:hypothetical protein
MMMAVQEQKAWAQVRSHHHQHVRRPTKKKQMLLQT